MFARSHLLAAVTVAASLVGALVLVAGEGCTVLTNDALPDDAGIFEGGDASSPFFQCQTCLTAACLAPASLCLTSDTCTSVQSCGDDAGCACGAPADGGPSPDRLYRAYTSCFNEQVATCAIDCAGPQPAPRPFADCTIDAGTSDAGDAGDASITTDAGATGTDACIACAAANCASAVASCGSDSECEAFLTCSSACSPASCITDCETQHPTGKVAASELATCTATSCKNDCQL